MTSFELRASDSSRKCVPDDLSSCFTPTRWSGNRKCPRQKGRISIRSTAGIDERAACAGGSPVGEAQDGAELRLRQSHLLFTESLAEANAFLATSRRTARTSPTDSDWGC